MLLILEQYCPNSIVKVMLITYLDALFFLSFGRASRISLSLPLAFLSPFSLLAVIPQKRESNEVDVNTDLISG